MTVVIASLVVRPIAVVDPIVVVLRRVLLRLRVLVPGGSVRHHFGTRWMGLAGLAPLVALRPARRAVLGAVTLAGFRRAGGLDRRRRHDRRRRGCRCRPRCGRRGGPAALVSAGLLRRGRGRRRRGFAGRADDHADHGPAGRLRRRLGRDAGRRLDARRGLRAGGRRGRGRRRRLHARGRLRGPPRATGSGRAGCRRGRAGCGGRGRCPGGVAWAVGGGTTAIGAVGVFWNPIPSATDGEHEVDEAESEHQPESLCPCHVGPDSYASGRVLTRAAPSAAMVTPCSRSRPDGLRPGRAAPAPAARSGPARHR